MYNDDLFNYLRKIFEEFKAQEQSFWNAAQKVDFESGKPLTWGYSFSLGPDGVPKYKTFSNIPNFDRNLNFNENERALPTEEFKERDNLTNDGFRIPHTDFLSEEENDRLIVELPGVEKENIDVKAKSNSLTITAENEKFKYKKTIPLNFKTIPKKIKSSFKNGILELVLPKDSQTEDEGQRIKVE